MNYHCESAKSVRQREKVKLAKNHRRAVRSAARRQTGTSTYQANQEECVII